mmetsp:Transcript_101428/g.160381  ORF Transcript_101428/g.160381 Transcript_101428/m.160381 type:complete len:149 (-) Transcript_101428:72-518(-)
MRKEEPEKGVAEVEVGAGQALALLAMHVRVAVGSGSVEIVFNMPTEDQTGRIVGGQEEEFVMVAEHAVGKRATLRITNIPTSTLTRSIPIRRVLNADRNKLGIVSKEKLQESIGDMRRLVCLTAKWQDAGSHTKNDEAARQWNAAFEI